MTNLFSTGRTIPATLRRKPSTKSIRPLSRWPRQAWATRQPAARCMNCPGTWISKTQAATRQGRKTGMGRRDRLEVHKASGRKRPWLDGPHGKRGNGTQGEKFYGTPSIVPRDGTIIPYFNEPDEMYGSFEGNGHLIANLFYNGCRYNCCRRRSRSPAARCIQTGPVP